MLLNYEEPLLYYIGLVPNFIMVPFKHVPN